MKLPAVFAVLVLEICGLPAYAGRPASAWIHEIDVTLDPGRYRLDATDRITVGTGGCPSQFRLHSRLEIVSLSIDGKNAKPSLRRADSTGAAPEAHLTTWQSPPCPAGSRLQISYQGEIHDPVSPEEGLGFVAGDSTTGLVSPEGIFLDSGTGWVPLLAGDELAMYNVTSRVPEPWRVVTQGRRETARAPKGISAQRFVAEVPSDGLALVAGKYAVRSLEHDGVVVSTYFFEEESALSALFLARTVEYLDRFEALLGPYPYSRFDIVENFFTTGYGYPSFTLLGRDVVRMGEMALRPGYVDHEIVHCWWGNYVYPDMETGNWSEGLTTYFANYLAQEEAGLKEAADYRRGLAQKYSLRVTPELEYPLARFRQKQRDFENEIGYGKAAMVFHMLRRMSGDEAFFGTLRRMTVTFGGRRAGWADFREAFEQATGRDLGVFFEEWIQRPGLPVLALESARSERSQSGGARYRVAGAIGQGGGTKDTYHLPVPVIVETTQGRREYAVALTGRVTQFTFEVDALPLEIRLDPDMQVLRRLPPVGVPSLNAALESRNKLAVLPDSGGEEYAELARVASTAKGAVVRQAAQLKAGLPAETSLLVLGRPDQNAVAGSLLGRLDTPIVVGPAGFTLAGESFKGPKHSLLFSGRHPDDPNQIVTFFFGMSPEALDRSRNLFYYGWDSWVVFDAGRPVRRGTLELAGPAERRPLVSDITSGDGGITGVALLEQTRALASPEMRGRRPGTPGHVAAAAWIERYFAEHGVAPAGDVAPFVEGYRHAFTMPIVDIDAASPSSAEILVSRSGAQSRYAASPFPIPPGPAGSAHGSNRVWSDEVVFLDPEDLASQAGSKEAPRLPGGTIITVERSFPAEAGAPGGSRAEIDPRAALLLADSVRGAARLGASTLIFLRGSDGPSVYDALLSFPSRPSVADAAALEARRKSGDFPGADIFFSGRASRLPFPGPPPELLVLSAGPELGADLFGRHSFSRRSSPPLEAPHPGYKPILLDLQVSATAPLRVERKPMVNVIGYLQGSDPALRSEAILVTAHYDAMGVSESGVLLAGAADNAAGVSALLEMARWLADPARRPARSVVLAAMDGEEWGLAGSRALSARLGEMSLRPVALVNIDSIGSRDVARPFLIGGSHHPVIRTAVETLAATIGLKLGRDIDPYAFEYGSDYYPFHLTGLPAVGFFAADYRSLHRAADNLESLDAAALEKVSRLAALTVWALAM